MSGDGDRDIRATVSKSQDWSWKLRAPSDTYRGIGLGTLEQISSGLWAGTGSGLHHALQPPPFTPRSLPRSITHWGGPGTGECWGASEKLSLSPRTGSRSFQHNYTRPFPRPDPTSTQFPGWGVHQRNWGRRSHCPWCPQATHPIPRRRAGPLRPARCARAAAPESAGAEVWLACAATWREDEAPGGSPRVAS